MTNDNDDFDAHFTAKLICVVLTPNDLLDLLQLVILLLYDNDIIVDGLLENQKLRRREVGAARTT